jgi:hypothetical protein
MIDSEVKNKEEDDGGEKEKRGTWFDLKEEKERNLPYALW